jgi:hypothetical protein
MTGEPRNYLDDEARETIATGYQAASAQHLAHPNEHTSRILLTLGFLHALILAQQAELEQLRSHVKQ